MPAYCSCYFKIAKFTGLLALKTLPPANHSKILIVIKKILKYDWYLDITHAYMYIFFSFFEGGGAFNFY